MRDDADRQRNSAGAGLAATASAAAPASGSAAASGSVRAKAAATFAASVHLENVERKYDDVRALDGVDLHVEPGEIVSLLGPSGCGKTTMLRIIAGIERPTGGRVLIGTREVAGPRMFIPPEHRNVGLMFQDFALFPHMTVLDNVAFGLAKLASTEREKAAAAILERVGMGSLAHAYPSTLSGGQQQRVALARAIIPRPAVMLMDEPFSGLDVQLRDAMQDETLSLLRETRATSLIVTHHPEEAMRLSDRIVVMRAGRLVQAGTARQLYDAPQSLFVARLFSEVNEISGRVADGAIATPAGTFAAPDLADGAVGVVCLRERAIGLAPLNGNGPVPGLQGRVQALRFLGDITRVDVVVDGFAQPLRARVPTGNVLTRGSDVAVTIAPEDVLVFAAENGA